MLSTEEFDKLLNDLGLKEIENKLPSEASGGQKHVSQLLRQFIRNLLLY